MVNFKTILHATDFSERSAFAFRLACSLARDYGARLIVLHVAQPPLAVATEGVLMLPQAIDQELEQLRAKLHQIRPDDPKVQAEQRLSQGDAASEIVRVAGEVKCDLIVIGTHGRTGLARVLLGSVAEQVLRRALCPVLIVKTPLPEAQPAPEPTS